MRRLSILLLFFSLLACNKSQTTLPKTQDEASNHPAASKPSNSTSVKSASVLSSNTMSSNESVLAEFPFDINLKDINGKITKSDEVFKSNGKPTVLLFWLTTCAPCHRKLNAIKPLYPQWKKEADFNLFAISGDYEKNFPAFVSQTTKKDWEWETYNDCERAFRNVLPGQLNGYPQTFIFDKTGKLVYQDKRYRIGDETKLFETIKKICAKG